MAITGSDPVARCTPEEWTEFLGMVRHGMLFEVIEWLDAGKPSLRPERKFTSAFESAITAPNLSMTQILWERGWQEEREVSRALSTMTWENPSKVVLRYLLEAGCPIDGLCGMDLCLTHDLDLIRLGIDRGVDMLEPDGWAAAFVRVGSRPLIHFYIEQKDRIPGLRKDAVYALCRAIKESRLRAIALLRWAGVDPLGRAPRYEDWDEPEESWTGFPALKLSYSEKPVEILKLLKLKPTISQWFDLVDSMTYGCGDALNEVLAIMPDPMAMMRQHPAHAEQLLTNLLRNICWSGSWNAHRDEQRVAFCIKLLEGGVKLRWNDPDDLGSMRRYLYRSEKKKLIFRVLRRAAELADPKDREQLIHLINKPKMRELTIQHEYELMVLLGLLPSTEPLSRNRFQVRRIVRPRSSCTNQTAYDGRPGATFRPEKRSWQTEPEPQDPSPKPHEIKRQGSTVLERKQLHAEIWKEPAMHVAARHGISGSMLARICTQLQIPRPPRGYWAKPKSWRQKNKKRLPKWKGTGADYWVINPVNVRAQTRLKGAVVNPL